VTVVKGLKCDVDVGYSLSNGWIYSLLNVTKDLSSQIWSNRGNGRGAVVNLNTHPKKRGFEKAFEYMTRL